MIVKYAIVILFCIFYCKVGPKCLISGCHENRKSRMRIGDTEILRGLSADHLQGCHLILPW